MQGLHRGRRNIAERPVAKDRVIARNGRESDIRHVDPDPAEMALLAYHDIALGPAHDGDDIAGTIGRAKKHDLRAGKAGRDRDEVAREIGEQGLVGAGWRYSAEQQSEQGEGPEELHI